MSTPPSANRPDQVSSAAYIVKTTDDASGNIEYFGEAPPGSATSAAVWRIRKLTYTAGGNPSWLWAGGVDTFTGIWDNRTALVYS